MKNRVACFLLPFCILQPLTAQYRTALPGYKYEFPRDYFNHADFQTEWWYYTGNLIAKDGHHFGFELTFFRQAVRRDSAKASAWDMQDLFLADLALSDLNGGHFYHSERTNRSGPSLAGVSQPDGRIWNGNWQIQWQGDVQTLLAIDDRFQLRLTLRPEKPPVIHGENGLSQKAEGRGRASHYISLTRIGITGSVDLAGTKFDVTGTSWMDHEFFTNQLEANQTGWNWLSLQMDDRTELMLFHIRRKDGSIDPFSAGTFIDAQGQSTHLRAGDFNLQPAAATWTSPNTQAAYPIRWKIAIPKLGIQLEANTSLASQELTGKTKLWPNYWEGAIAISGKHNNQPVAGVGYLEMTGYDRPVRLIP
ncbi:MAG TPA: lipocalin-like domain-containing protein [Candidatus Dormibacteraeota bacterium]|nr:lipocalin-like domain-containing protein [Candidatus Dormibacteraeota bacterium]